LVNFFGETFQRFPQAAKLFPGCLGLYAHLIYNIQNSVP
jgi:hypothetical protein